MKCTEVCECLEEYILNEVDESTKVVLENHLAACQDCSREYEELKASIEGIKGIYRNVKMPDALRSIQVKKKSGGNKIVPFRKAVIMVASLAAVIVLSFVYSAVFTNKASAEDYRGGFHVSPVEMDSTGVKPDSKYILKSQEKISLEDLKKRLSIDGEPAPEVEKEKSNIFYIKPSRPFEQNKLYTFRIKQDNHEDVLWTFQTSAVFKIVSAFPADRTTDVPTNTGIEIYFSHEDYENIDSYFEITPAVGGSFERHKRAEVFVPKGLKEGTLYTVKVKKGLRLKGTSYTLADDYVFMFETVSKDNQPMYEKGNLSYNKSLNEYSPGEKPYLPFNYYVNPEKVKGEIKIKTTVYSYPGMQPFIEALKKKDSFPNWAYRSVQKNVILVDGLDKVLEFEQKPEQNPGVDQCIRIPQALPAGYYIVSSQWEDMKFQTFIEVTDIGMYITRGTNKTLIWLNDLSTKKPIEGAALRLTYGNYSNTSDVSGIAYFDSILTKNELGTMNENGYQYFEITTMDHKTAVLGYSLYAPGSFGNQQANLYWNYLQMDRNLYKPDDQVNFWGFIKNRYTNEQISSLTLEIGQGYGYMPLREGVAKGMRYFPTDGEPMVKKVISLENGIFKDSIQLPNLDPGGYQLTLKKGQEIIASSYITVENYIKPPYKIEITSDKKAVFPGQPVNFTINAAFFEGTAVPDLGVRYNINDSSGGSPVEGNTDTDKEGDIQVKYSADPPATAQGEQQVGIYCNATLPEIGEMAGNGNVRLFVNDINVDTSASLKNKKGTINAVVNKVVLDRLNNGTEKDYNDYLGDLVSGKGIGGTIYKHTWLRIEEGEYYDFINKVTQKRYRYEEQKEDFKDFKMTTGADGKASFEFDAPELTDGFYTAELVCQDQSGRYMHMNVYVGNNEFEQYNPNNDNRYYLDGGKESYDTGDKVDLTFKKGKQSLPDGKYLFIKMQNGIREYFIKDNSTFSFGFSEKDIPDVYVTGVYFNGMTYVESEPLDVRFDYKQKNLVIEAATDKTSYKPGDEVVIKVTAKDKSGAPKKAVVNISLVDEALLKLNDQWSDTLASLYTGVPSGQEYSYRSHTNSNSGNAIMTGNLDIRGGIHTTFNKEMKGAIYNSYSTDPSSVKMKFDESVTAKSFAIRQDFKDTAYFSTIRLDENGVGELKFKLPDNVTSWRVTLAGVTPDLSAGSNKVSLNVSLPFFINYTLNSTYLVGDKPVLGVNAYGNNLKKGETVMFEVSSKNNPDKVRRAEGKAFERVNIPLWELAEGTDEIIIKASTPGGLSDAMIQKVNVVTSYHQIETAQYYNAVPGLTVEGGKKGNTKLVFSDQGRGAFYPQLISMLYTDGNRVDQKLSSRVASELIAKYFGEDNAQESDSSFKVTQYQREDGGIALLPYGNSDPDVSAKLVPLIKDQVNAQRLKQYFYSLLYNDDPGIKGSALYGLAALKEPVLLNLDKAAAIENAGIKDLIFVALAYSELGEMPKTMKLYNERIITHFEEYSPYMRINKGNDNDDILECTSLASILASRLDRSQKKALYDYCVSNATKDILVNIEKLLYINQEIAKTKDEKVKFSYTLGGERYAKELQKGMPYTLTLPSRDISQFKVESVEGKVSLVSVYSQAVTDIEKHDSNISVSRTYFKKDGTKTNTFGQNDIVKIVLDWHIGTKAIDGGYQITDFLPSGLKPIENTMNVGIDPSKEELPYKRTDGQKVMFYAGKGWKKETPLVYYARIVSPGAYKADSAVIQSTESKDSINTGTVDNIMIN